MFDDTEEVVEPTTPVEEVVTEEAPVPTPEAE